MSNAHRHRLPSNSSSPEKPTSSPGVHLQLPCYEGPDGRGPGVLELNDDALCRHLFFCGSTGSGKTTWLRALMRQLICAKAEDNAQKVGLVVLDFKADDTINFVKAAAAAAGRAGDVRVLSIDSDTSYNFFADCRGINKANEYAARLLFGCGDMSRGNDIFWNEFRQNLLAAALTWLVTLHRDKRTFSHWISHASSWLLADSLTPELRTELGLLRVHADNLEPGTAARIAIDQAVKLIEEWDGVLDSRTRGNSRATLHNALRPLLEEPVLHMFRSNGAKEFRVASAVEEGRILVVSINSFLHPELAALVGKCVKSDLYGAVFSRKPGGRFVTLIADEYQLVATAGNSRCDDATALPLLREYRAGIVAATQTLVGLDKAVGLMNRRLLLANFNTLVFLRSIEAELDAFAEQVCGTVEIDVTVREHFHDPFGGGAFPAGSERKVVRRMRRHVCPRGSLARLQPGQAYILRQTGEPCAHPVWVAVEEFEADFP